MARPKHNAENERIKRRYMLYLRDAHGRSAQTIAQAMRAIEAFERASGLKNFKAFHIEQARAWKRMLHDGGLAVSTRNAQLHAVKHFFKWLADQPGYKARIRHADAEYFNLTEKETRVAQASRPRAVPTLEQLVRVLEAAPAATDAQRRDRAIIAFVLLTGVRDGAMISLKLKHVDLGGYRVIHDAREVDTKFSRSYETWFFPVPDIARDIVEAWIHHLRDDLDFSPDDPLFPATERGLDRDGRFVAVSLSRHHWTTTTPVRKAFKDGFLRVGLPYFNPHSIRKTLATLGQRRCQTPEELKAWSQNLGHEDVMTTLRSYGAVTSDRQAELMKRFHENREDTPPDDAVRLAEAILRAKGRVT